jgi:hypothetical protein
MIFFSQNKPPLLFSGGVILDLSGYYGVFLARGFAGALAADALAATGFFSKVRFFFSAAAFGAGAVSTANGGSGTYGIGVVFTSGSTLTGIGPGHAGCVG